MIKHLMWSCALAILFVAEPSWASTHCTMKFRLEGWSAFYETSHGNGTITCDNGQSARVVLHSKGGGATFGKTKIVDGTGTFSPIESIGEVFGTYAKAEAHAGAGESKMAEVVTKGPVSLTLTGEGQGVDLGFSFGKFEIARAPAARARRHHHDNDNH
jgi:hypothetical protein